MFDLKSFIVTKIVNGVKNGTFTKEYANIMAVNYLVKGVLTEAEVQSISEQIEAWENEPKEEVEEQTEEPLELPADEPLEMSIPDPVEAEEPVEAE